MFDYSEDYFLSITQRLGKKTIYGWTLDTESSTGIARDC